MRKTTTNHSLRASVLACVLVVLLALSLLPALPAQAQDSSSPVLPEFEHRISTNIIYDQVVIQAQDSTGTRLQGVKIQVTKKPASSTDPAFPPLTTNEQGEVVQAGLVPGNTYTFTATKDKYSVVDGQALEFVFAGTSAFTQVVKLTPEIPPTWQNTLQVNVFDYDEKQKLQGATVQVESVGTKLTDVDGKADFSPLTQRASYQVTASKDGYETLFNITYLPDGSDLNVYLHKAVTIKGKVVVYEGNRSTTTRTEQETREVLEGARVTLSEVGEKFTSTRGEVEFANLKLGKIYEVMVYKEDLVLFEGEYVADGKPLEVVLHAPVPPAGADASVEVLVLDADGDTVSDAKVELIDAEGKRSNSQTDNDGFVLFKNLTPEMGYRLLVSKQDCKPFSANGVTGNTPVTVVLQKAEEPKRVPLPITAVDAYGQVMKDVTVEVKHLGQAVATVSTNNNGTAVVSDVIQGLLYDVKATASDNKYKPYECSVPADGKQLVVVMHELALPPTPVETTVSVLDNETGSPLAGAKVVLSGAASGEKTTNNKGEVTFELMTGSIYTVKASPSGYTPASQTFKAAADTKLIVLRLAKPAPSVSAEVEVVDEENGAVEGASVQLQDVGTKTTNSAGKTTFYGLVSGTTYQVKVSKEGYVTYGWASFAANGSTWKVMLVKQQPQPNPAEQALITVVDKSNNSVVGAVVAVEGKSALLTNLLGQVQVVDLTPAETYRVKASKEGYLPAETTYVATGAPLVMVLQKNSDIPTVSVEVTMLDSAGKPLADVAVEVAGIGTGATNASGRVVFEGLQTGKTYVVKAARSGYVAVESSYLADGTPLTLVMQQAKDSSAGDGAGGAGGTDGGARGVVGVGVGGAGGAVSVGIGGAGGDAGGDAGDTDDGGNTPLIKGPGGLSITGSQLAGFAIGAGAIALLAALLLLLLVGRRKSEESEESEER